MGKSPFFYVFHGFISWFLKVNSQCDPLGLGPKAWTELDETKGQQWTKPSFPGVFLMLIFDAFKKGPWYFFKTIYIYIRIPSYTIVYLPSIISNSFMLLQSKSHVTLWSPHITMQHPPFDHEFQDLFIFMFPESLFEQI